MLSKLRRKPPRQFREGIAQSDIELRGVRARSMQFADGCRDPSRALVCIAGMGADGRSFVRQRPLSRDWTVVMVNTPFETPPGVDPLEFTADTVEELMDHEGLE